MRRRLTWLDLSLRFDGFEPLATGVRTMLEHVDDFLPAHNIDRLTSLANILAKPHQALFRAIA